MYCQDWNYNPSLQRGQFSSAVKASTRCENVAKRKDAENEPLEQLGDAGDLRRRFGPGRSAGRQCDHATGKSGAHWQEHIWFPTPPLKALREKLPNTKVTFDPGTDLQSATSLAKSSDLTIVFAYQWESEGMDLANLSFPDNQDALIEQVAAANLHTIVVLETGNGCHDAVA